VCQPWPQIVLMQKVLLEKKDAAVKKRKALGVHQIKKKRPPLSALGAGDSRRANLLPIWGEGIWGAREGTFHWEEKERDRRQTGASGKNMGLKESRPLNLNYLAKTRRT